MGKANTYFEQVPLAVAIQVAQAEARSSNNGMARCAICGAPIELERCKIDEDGDAVHDKCYLTKINSAAKLPRSRSAS
jgi:hypothetical protein